MGRWNSFCPRVEHTESHRLALTFNLRGNEAVRSIFMRLLVEFDGLDRLLHILNRFYFVENFTDDGKAARGGN